MNITPKIFAIIFSFLPLMACAENKTQEFNPQLSIDVESKIYFRAWNSKGLGDVKSTQKIGVLYTEGLIGSVGILRISPDGAGFVLEEYVPDNALSPDVWTYSKGKVEKVLTKQPANLMMILEMVPGSQGGQRIEKFRLN